MYRVGAWEEMALACCRQPPAHLSHTLPPKPAHLPQCFMYHPGAASIWPCLEAVLAPWVPAPGAEPLLPWFPLVTLPWTPWSQHVQPKLLLPDPGVSISANGPTVTQLPKPETWELGFSRQPSQVQLIGKKDGAAISKKYHFIGPWWSPISWAPKVHLSHWRWPFSGKVELFPSAHRGLMHVKHY